MLKAWLWETILALALAGLITACTPEPAEPTPAALVSLSRTTTQAVEPTATRTSTAMPSETWTATASVTSSATATLVPTRTATPSATLTQVPTATATGTPTRAPLPTATLTSSPRPEAPRFPQTSYGPFDANSLRRELQELVTFQSNFMNYFQRVIEGAQGNCRTFYQYRNELIISQEAYYDVPDVWYSLYYRYRVLILEAVNNIQPVTGVCDAGGGDVPPETDQAIFANLELQIAQAQQLVVEAATIP